MGKPLRILLVEDNEDHALLLVHELERGGYDPVFERMETPRELDQALLTGAWDIILSDYTLPELSGLEAIRIIRSKRLDIPIIVVSGTRGEDHAVEAMRAGAQDFILKDNLARLVPAVDREVAEAEGRRQHRQAEEALEESERRFRNVLENIKLVGIMIDARGRMVFCNDHLLGLTGWRREEVMGRDWAETFLPADARARIREAIQAAVLSGEFPGYNENEIVTRDGERRLIAWNNTTHGDGAGLILTSIGEDITERRRAEAELRDSEARYRTLTDHLPGVVTRIGRDLRYRFINAPIETVTGTPPSQYIGKSIWEVGEDEEVVRLFERHLREVFASGKETSFDYSFETPAGMAHRQMLIVPETADGQADVALTLSYDIKAIKEAEEGLRENEERFRSFFEASLDPVLLTAPDGSVLAANKAAQKMLGATEEEIKAGGRDTFVDTSDPRFQAFVEERTRTGKATGVFRSRRKDGTIFPTEVSSGIFIDAHGNLRSTVVSRDITEREQAAAALHQAKEEAERALGDIGFIAEATNLGLWSADLPLGKLSWNRQVKEHFWLLPDQEPPAYEDFFNLLHPDDRERARLVIENSIAENSLFEVTYRSLSPQGRIRWVHAQGRATYGADGRPVRFSGITQDVTEWKLAEEALRESRNFLKVLTDNVPGMVGYWDKDLRCRFANKAYTEWFGRRPEDILGLTIQELMGEELFRKNEPHIMDALRGKRQQYERPLVKASGEVGHVLADYIPDLDEGGGVRGFYVLVTDVTPVKQAEIREREMNEQLRAERDRAEEATRAKSEFLANMSHEIRTPMNGVIGMTELALREDIPQEAREYLQLVKQSGRNLLAIINDILDLSKIEAGKVELEHKSFLLRPLIDSVVKPLAMTSEGKSLTLRHSIDVEVPDTLVGDAGRLRQVLTNIIGNGVKFTEAGGVTVTVTTSDEPASSTDRARLLFQVRDTGIGIPRDRLEHVFESFAQVGGSAHVAYGGTGLGLTISKELVEMMGGGISVESEVGKGSLFSFTAEFGLAEGVRPDRPEEARTGQVPQPLQILLVEDNLINRMLAVDLLKRDGHTVTVASNGREALEELKRRSYDMVLMDIRMPEMGGEEATRRIRGGETPDPKVVIVALTAHALKGDRERFIAAGMDDYLPKPIDVEELRQAFTRVMAKRNKGGPHLQ